MWFLLLASRGGREGARLRREEEQTELQKLSHPSGELSITDWLIVAALMEEVWFMTNAADSHQEATEKLHRRVVHLYSVFDSNWFLGGILTSVNWS